MQQFVWCRHPLTSGCCTARARGVDGVEKVTLNYKGYYISSHINIHITFLFHWSGYVHYYPLLFNSLWETLFDRKCNANRRIIFDFELTILHPSFSPPLENIKQIYETTNVHLIRQWFLFQQHNFPNTLFSAARHCLHPLWYPIMTNEMMTFQSELIINLKSKFSFHFGCCFY